MSTPTPNQAQSFRSFALPASLLTALDTLKFATPTPIQSRAIPIGLEGRDVMGIAQTGTGKTAAFTLPLLSHISADHFKCGLILVPTRELGTQVHQFILKLAGHDRNLRFALLIGGTSMRSQIRDLKNNPRIIIATPGRLVDHLQNHNPRMLSKFTTLVLDEADRMLDMGFVTQLRTILKALPTQRQTMMFSATFAPEVKSLASQYLRNPVEVAVGATSKPIEKIEQDVIHTSHKEKNDKLTDELNAREGSVLIFTRTKHRADRLCRFLDDCGYSVSRIHGNRTQAQRQQAIDGFRRGTFRILVATDIASRGLDIDDIAHVINYDLPQVPEDYVHRIGRTARNGKDGKALCFLTPDDTAMWKAIERLIHGKSGSAGQGSSGQQRQAHGQRQGQAQGQRPFKKPFKRNSQRKFGRGQRSGQGQKSSRSRW